MDKPDWGFWQVIIGIIAIVLAIVGLITQISSTSDVKINNINTLSLAEPAPTLISTPTTSPKPTSPKPTSPKEDPSDYCDCTEPSLPTPVDISPYLHWSFNTSKDNIYIDIPDGYSFVSVIINIHNDGNDPISTDPSCWEFISGGVSYSYEPTTSALDIASQSEVKPGENLTIIVNYLVEGTPTIASLKYDSP